MAMFLYPFYTVCHLFLLAWAHYLYYQSHQIGLVILILVITAIAYDNLIVSVGSLIGKGKTLLKLSHPRFMGHVLLTPLSILAAFSFCLQSHMEWAFQPLSIFSVCFLVISLIAAEIVTYYRKFEPKEVWFEGTLRYTNSAYKMLPIPSIITTILVGIIGLAIWQQVGSPWLLVSSIVMFVGGAIPQCVAGPVVCSGVEVCLIVGFCMTAAQLQNII
ncbi:hypothetical protein H6F42_12290 [Pseudanabaena sp. FACHB-1998]|uniref:hypothetical protein n=1 Tax=Pseudanabaena sp. FACHB-1998 TaxID=2692858 RepID=UPI0016801855|nr:hypothetical protein [Pseudanabaena sp. FACHB-1998]MBD2177694.1 hypothetical protein [Pseudanabaena sp. FACHB-1998]